MKLPKAEDHLIVALDVDRIEQARSLVKELEGIVDFFKIGIGLQLEPEVNTFIRELANQGKRIFLDYKYLDIEATVERAVSQAARIGVTFVTVHHANRSILDAAIRGRGESDLKLLTVTVLTSLDEEDIREMGYNCSVQDLVLLRARQAVEWGCDGVIASGREAALIRGSMGTNLLIVTPGIRPEGSSHNDQKRIVTPTEAIVSGADFLVIGRPIIGSDNPAQAAKAILTEMREAFQARQQLAPIS